MTTHWIITNRRVVKSGNREVVEDFDAQGERIEALPTFRVAEFKTRGLPAKPAVADLVGAVHFVPDTLEPGYAGLDRDTDPGALPGSQRMFKSLYDTMCAAPEGKGDTLFFIHGFNYSWEDALVHLHRLAEVYAAPKATSVSNIVYFTWPSWGVMRKYWKDQRIAAPSGQLLGRVFSKLVRFYEDFFNPEKRRKKPELCGKRIHLAAHSMGNQVMREFVRTVIEQEHLRHPIFGETLMLNADIEWTALNPGQPLHFLPTLADRVHVYNHYSDDALRHSSLVKNPGEKRLGQHGPESTDTNILPPRTVVVDCSSIRPRISDGSAQPLAAAVGGGAGADGSRERDARLVGGPVGPGRGTGARPEEDGHARADVRPLGVSAPAGGRGGHLAGAGRTRLERDRGARAEGDGSALQNQGSVRNEDRTRFVHERRVRPVKRRRAAGERVSAARRVLGMDV